MPGRILDEIRQTKPFSSAEEEAALNIQRTAGVLERRMSAILKPHKLSPVQYNVLRILRGAGQDGATCKDIGSRMVTADPDVTRLIDRLEQRGLVDRARSPGDRRFVAVRITPEGLKLLKQLEKPVRQTSIEALGHLGPERLQSLIELLEIAREA